MRIKFGRVTDAARRQDIGSTFRKFGWIMSKLKRADDDTEDHCTVKLVTVLEQFLRYAVETMIDTGKIPPGKLVGGERPGPEKLGKASLGRYVAFL